MHHLDLIKERWPKTYKVVLSPPIRFVLLLVAIGLFVESMRERRQGTEDFPPPKAAAPPQSVPTVPQSGPAVTTGDQSPATTGNDNTVNYGTAPKGTKKK